VSKSESERKSGSDLVHLERGHAVGVIPGGGAGEIKIDVKRFRGGLVFKAHRWLFHSTPGSRVIKQKKKERGHAVGVIPGGG